MCLCVRARARHENAVVVRLPSPPQRWNNAGHAPFDVCAPACVRACTRLDVRPQWMTRRPALSQRDPFCSCLRVRKLANTGLRTRPESICRWLPHSCSPSFHLPSSPLALYQSAVLRQEVTSLLVIPSPPCLHFCFNLSSSMSPFFLATLISFLKDTTGQFPQMCK